MPFENVSLGTLLSDPRIAPIASKAICNRDLSTEPLWNKTLTQLNSEQIFSGEIGKGIERLYQAAETGEWYFPLYNGKECEEGPGREDVNVVWLPSKDPGADERPFILLVPGGGFVNVWSLTEGWPVAEQFNRCGYHVFVLTYQLDAEEKLLENNMQDFARALQFIRANENRFHLRGDCYITCGFSAGGYLICLWNTKKGYPLFDLPKPQASFPVYPVTSLKKRIRYDPREAASALRLYGCSVEEAAESDYEIPEHVEGFPPCAIFVAAEDELVNPENSKVLAKALEESKIPCRLEIGPTGGHGFADGSGMCMSGWTQRAVQWYVSIKARK